MGVLIFGLGMFTGSIVTKLFVAIIQHEAAKGDDESKQIMIAYEKVGAKIEDTMTY